MPVQPCLCPGWWTFSFISCPNKLFRASLVLTALWSICCCCLVAQLCPTLWNPMNCSTPGFPVYHHLPELAQTHVHWVGDAIQPSHPLSCPSPPAFNLSQHQSLFQWVSSSLIVLARVLELQLFSNSPSNEYSGLISFRIDWFDPYDLLSTPNSCLQRASVLTRKRNQHVNLTPSP